MENYTTVHPKQIVFFKAGLQGRGGYSSPELGDTRRHRETNVKAKDCKRLQPRAGRQKKDYKAGADTAVRAGRHLQLRIARRGRTRRRAENKCKGLQGRGGHSSRELGDKCRHRETHVKDCKRQQPKLGDKCKGWQGRAVQSWETNVKGCKREADIAAQSWETIA